MFLCESHGVPIKHYRCQGIKFPTNMTNFANQTATGQNGWYVWLLLIFLRTTAVFAEPWQPIFNKINLQDWQIIKTESFVHHGKITVKNGHLCLRAGQPGTGIRYLKPIPRTNYELLIEARREEGFDFFCGLTFPVGSNYCTFVAGGWDGDITGLSNINRRSAADNETTTSISYETGRWYTFLIRVTPKQISVHVDDQQIINADIRHSEIGIRPTMQPLIPLGLSSWYTQAGVRNLRIRSIQNEPTSKARRTCHD